MPIKLRNISTSQYGDIIDVKIIDIDGSDDQIEFDIEEPFYTIELNGDKNDPFSPIRTTSIDGNIILDANTEFIFNDIFQAQEGRFFVEIEITKPSLETIKYIGKIVQDGVERDDRINPTFYFKAIDGITDLKGKKWDHPDAYMKISDALCYIFRKLEIYQLMENPTMLFYSEIEPNTVAYTDGRLADVTWVNNYFYNSENDEKVYWNCYDVLLEILKRLNLQLFIYNNVFYVLGNETIFGTVQKKGSNYDVSDGSFISTRNISTSPIFSNININDTALAGGRYFFTSGFNKVEIIANPKFSNRKVGDTTLSKLVYPAITSVSYKRQPGIVKENKVYRIIMTVDVVSITKSNNNATTPGFFTVTHNVREENTTNNTQTVIITDYKMIIPTNIGKYHDEIIITEKNYHRLMDVSTSISGLSGTNMTSMVVNVSYTFAEQIQNYKDIKIISEIPSSKFVKTKKIEIYGNHEKGNEIVQFYFQNSTSGIKYTNEFRLYSGSWVALEKLISEDQIFRLGNRIELNIDDNDLRNSFIRPINTINYKSISYKIIGFKYQTYKNIYNLELLRQDDNTGTIVTTFEVPINDSDLNGSDFGTISAMMGNIDRYFKQYYSEHSNVTGSYIEVDLDNYFNGTIQEIKTYWQVYVNGIRYTYKDKASVSSPPSAGQLDIQEFTYLPATNRLYFGYDLEGSYVVLHFIGISKPIAEA